MSSSSKPNTPQKVPRTSLEELRDALPSLLSLPMPPLSLSDANSTTVKVIISFSFFIFNLI
jgi:hypothetical protein